MNDSVNTKRRNLLKGTAGVATAAMFGGRAPYVMSQENKTLRYLGTAVNQSPEIAAKVKEDLGITLEYIPVTTDEVTKRIVTQPNSFDLVDTEYFSLKKLVPSGNLLGMDANRIKLFDEITPAFTKGEIGGKKIGDQGTAPKKVFYLQGETSKEFSDEPTEWVTLIPTVYNADTLGIRPDLIGRPIKNWSELLNPEFKGKASILNIPSIGIMDAAMVVESMGEYEYPDKGNMTKEEIDMTMKIMTEAKKAGQFRAFWSDFNESVNLMASGEVVIQSMWSPALQLCAQKVLIAFTSHSKKVTVRGPRVSRCRLPLKVKKPTSLTSLLTGSSLAGLVLTSTGRVTTQLSCRLLRRIWKPTSGTTGCSVNLLHRTSCPRMARSSHLQARYEMVVRMKSEWATLNAGML